MSDAMRIACRHVTATTGATLLAAVLHLPQPFLAVLMAFILASGPSLDHGKILYRIVGVWVGVLGGIFLTVMFPEQPWVLLPAFAGMVAVGMHYTSLFKDESIILMTTIGAVATLPAGVIDPRTVLLTGYVHGIHLTCGILWAAFAFFLFPAKAGRLKETARIFSFRRSLVVGVTVALGMVVAAIFKPYGAVILTVASLIMIFHLVEPGLPPLLLQRSAGAVLGVMLSVLLEVLLADAGSNVVIFLAGMAVVFAALALIGQWKKKIMPCMLQAGAMFAVAAPMLPRPTVTLTGLGGRVEDVLVGCALGVGVYLVWMWGEKIESRWAVTSSSSS